MKLLLILRKSTMLLACLTMLILLPPFSTLSASDSLLEDSMTDDIINTSTVTAPGWNGIIPGETKLQWIIDNVKGLISTEEKDGKTILLFPPGITDNDNRVDMLFGRVAKVTCNSDGIVESINIGGYFPGHRPEFNALAKELGLSFKLISKTSSYSASSSVYKADNGYVWLIVSNIEVPDGGRQVLVSHYYCKSAKENLPLPVVHYRK